MPQFLTTVFLVGCGAGMVSLAVCAVTESGGCVVRFATDACHALTHVANDTLVARVELIIHVHADSDTVRLVAGTLSVGSGGCGAVVGCHELAAQGRDTRVNRAGHVGLRTNAGHVARHVGAAGMQLLRHAAGNAVAHGTGTLLVRKAGDRTVDLGTFRRKVAGGYG